MLLLALDIGTSICKASLVNETLNVADSEEIPYRTYFPKKNYAEQDPEDWWKCSVQAVRRLLERHPEAARQIAGIGTSGHMLGMLPVDNQGEALFPALIHADTRAFTEQKQIEKVIGAGHIYCKTGNVLSPSSVLCKTLWLKNNELEIYNKTARFLQSKDYLTYRMTGNMDSTDYSDASHASLMDIQKKCYLEEEFITLGIDKSKFPNIHKGTEIAGTLQPEAARAMGLLEGIPVIVGCGDGACSNMGAGIVKEGDVYCSLGTTAWIAGVRNEPFIDEKQRVFNIMSADGEHFGLFGTTQSAGRVVQWAQKLFELDTPQRLDTLASEAPPGCDGLFLLPYLEGERSPIFDADAKGIYFGITPLHTKSYFLRAALEGVAYALRSILAVFREKDNICSMRIIGGGAKSLLWKQIIADVCQTELCELNAAAQEAASVGAAAAAGTAVGIFPDLYSAAIKIQARKSVQMTEKMYEAYEKNFEKFMMLYPRVSSLF